MRWLVPLVLGCATPEGPAEDDVPPDEPPAWRPPGEVGGYAVGARTVRLERDDLGPLTVEVWYPAVATDSDVPGPYEEGVLRFEGHAIRDAPADPRGGPRPVVAFSHGNGGIRFQSFFLAEHLASHGFVVVAPDHAGTTLLDYRPDATAESAVRRPRDIADAADVVADLDGLDVDARTYAVVGHSFGAWTALAVGGAVLDAPAFEALCAAADPPAGCRYFRDQTFDLEAAAAYARPDPRARVVVGLAPGAWYTFGTSGEGLGAVRRVLLVGGKLDDELPFDPETTGAYAALGTPKALAAVEGAGHWQFTDLCPVLPIADCAGVPGGFAAPELTHARVNELVTAWIGRHLLDDARADVGLGARDGLTWESVP